MKNLLEKIIPESLIIKIYKNIPIPLSLKKKIVCFFNKKFLVAVQGIVLNDKNEILLLKHTYRDLPWGIPGGWMEYESPEEGIVREVHEETSMKIKSEKIIASIYNSKPHRIDIYIKCSYLEGEFKESPEVSDYGFFKVGCWPEGMPNAQIEVLHKLLSHAE